MKYWRIVVLVALLLLLSGCKQSTNEEIYYKIQKKLNTIESYQCIAKIQVNNQGQETEYVFQQTFKAPNQYRLEVLAPEGLKGNLTIYNGKTAWLKHPSINQTWKIDNFQQSQEQLMFIGYFLKNYISSKESDYEVEEVEGEKYLVMETSIPGGNYYFASQKLWVRTKDALPLKLLIYDEKKNIRFKVYYSDFVYNPQLDDNIFYVVEEEDVGLLLEER